MSLVQFNNGFSLQLSLDGTRFLGIGEVKYNGQLLRSPQLPWTFYTETEGTIYDGAWRFEDFTFGGVDWDGETAEILFSSTGKWMPRTQSADAMGDARITTRRLEAPVAQFRWRFCPIIESIWENEWNGLGMQLEVKSPGHPIHWVLEDTTWEIGGQAEGAVLIQQDVSTMDLEQVVRPDSAFSTIEKFFTEAADSWGGSYPMDMLPRAAGAAIGDFQVKGDLALFLYAHRPSLTRARIEKFATEDVIHYTDRPFIPLTEHAIFPERKLLVLQAPHELKRHEWRNLWLDCFTHARRHILDEFGFEVEVPIPSAHAHLWDGELKQLNEKWMEPLQDMLPRLSELGYKDVFTHGVWDSITSDPNPIEPGNICCPYGFTFADSFGGDDAMRKLIAKGKENDITILQWFSFHLSKHAKIWKEHPDWLLREANGDPWDGNYGSLWSGRIRSGYGKWFRESVETLNETTGLSGIFWDSYQNLGVTGIDWGAPDKAPQAEEIWEMQAAWQKLGYKQRCEVVTIFGVSQVAMYGFEDDKFRRRLWDDTVRNDDAFVLLDCSPAFFSSRPVLSAERLHPEWYFWLAGHRALPTASARPWDLPGEGSYEPGGELAEEYARVNHMYNRAISSMSRLRVSEEGKYTVWQNAEGVPAVIWAFAESNYPFTGEAQVLDGKTATGVSAEGELALQPGKVYVLTA